MPTLQERITEWFQRVAQVIKGVKNEFLTSENTWTKTQTFNPTSAASDGIIMKLLSWQTGKAVNIKKYDWTTIFKIDPYMAAWTWLLQLFSQVDFNTAWAPYMYGDFFSIINANNVKMVQIWKATGAWDDTNFAVRSPSGSNEIKFSEGSGVFSMQRNGTNIFRVAGAYVINFEGGASVWAFDQNLAATFTVTNTAQNRIGLIVKRTSWQTADLEQWRDESNNRLAGIDKNGGFVPASMSDATAANGTLYYSTTAWKLVYKDSSWVVNNLY